MWSNRAACSAPTRTGARRCSTTDRLLTVGIDRFRDEDDMPPLRVAIVGAGLAGLALAAALRRAGIDFDVYEQAPRLSEVGAGVQLAPNATRVLHRLGLETRLRRVAV